ncbi:lamin tail domain-containing protein [Citricoccus nitrophenolicus]
MKSPQNSPGVATQLAQLLEEHGLSDGAQTKGQGTHRIMVHSRDQDALREFNEILPEVPLIYLTGGEMLGDAELAELSTWTMGVFANPKVTTAADVGRAHEAGLEVYSDPMDDPDHMEMALNQGYDHLITNLPELANRVVDGRKTLFPDHEGVVVDNVIPNPEGNDVQPETGEHVALRNTTDEPVDVSGHYFRENGGRVIRIGDDYSIQPGSLLQVYVGPGTNTEDAYYNGSTSGFLNNTGGDVLTYFNEEHEVLDSWGYIIP